MAPDENTGNPSGKAFGGEVVSLELNKAVAEPLMTTFVLSSLIDTSLRVYVSGRGILSRKWLVSTLV